MNSIDIIFLVLIILSAIKGLVKGAISEVSSLVGLILGFWITIYYGNALEPLLSEYLEFQKFKWAVFLILFILIYITVSIIGKILTKTVKTLSLGPINRLLGLLIGSFKAIAFILIICLSYQLIEKNFQNLEVPSFSTSKTYIFYKENNISELIHDGLNAR